jgi:hypothetical protein
VSAPIDCLMEAKAAADVVRGELVKAIRKCPGPWGPEIEGLLKADDAAREGLAVALRSYDAIPEVDFTKPFATPPAPVAQCGCDCVGACTCPTTLAILGGAFR